MADLYCYRSPDRRGDQASHILLQLITACLKQQKAGDHKQYWNDFAQETVLNLVQWVRNFLPPASGRDSRAELIRATVNARVQNFPAYVCTIVHNVFAAFLNKHSPVITVDPHTDEEKRVQWVEERPDRPADFHDPYEHKRVRDALHRLRHEQPMLFAALMMVDVEEFKYEEAAQAAGIPLGSLKRYLKKARAWLKAKLGASEKKEKK
jgi:RNA polymerase sigma factor (sigma-70 family)